LTQFTPECVSQPKIMKKSLKPPFSDLNNACFSFEAYLQVAVEYFSIYYISKHLYEKKEHSLA